MGLIKGGFQRILQTIIYFLLFLTSAVILGIYSYFLSVLADNNQHIPTYEKAVEGISGAACLYLIFAVLLTCCLGGISFFAFFAIVLDICFAAAMIAVAYLTRDGADSCTGTVQTPLGDGPAKTSPGFGPGGFGLAGNDNTVYEVHRGLACKLNSAAFACSIIAALLFIVTAIMQVLLVRHHKKEKRYGPGPSNNYTSGYGKRKFGFGRKKTTTPNGLATKDAEAGPYPTSPVNRYSAEPGYTAPYTTSPNARYSAEPAYNAPQVVEAPPRGAHSGYYTAPTGTAASNPYGYTNTATNY